MEGGGGEGYLCRKQAITPTNGESLQPRYLSHFIFSSVFLSHCKIIIIIIFWKVCEFEIGDSLRICGIKVHFTDLEI